MVILQGAELVQSLLNVLSQDLSPVVKGSRFILGNLLFVCVAQLEVLFVLIVLHFFQIFTPPHHSHLTPPLMLSAHIRSSSNRVFGQLPCSQMLQER